MGTLVTIQVVRSGAEAAIERAFGWFHVIEAHCTRFDPQSELMQLTTRSGQATPASDILYETVRLALLVAEESGGAFDPTVTGPRDGDITFRDVRLDEKHRTITLLRPLILDLGAVAKGLAVDTAAREIEPFRDFAIDAGGDLYLGGCNPQGEPWNVGIRHPRPDGQIEGQLIDGELIDLLRVSNKAVCTSGDYERKSRNGPGHHILDPRTGHSAGALASVTVIAPNAMLADALATAAFVLGPIEGIPFLERLGVEGLLITPALQRHETRGFRDFTQDHVA